MAIQHKDITGNNVHEPKGIENAQTGTTYVSNGNGTGTWKRIGTDGIAGIPSGTPVANQVITTDGNGGLKLGSLPSYGSVGLSGSNYTQGTSWMALPLNASPGQLGLMTQVATGLKIQTPGVYLVDAYFSGQAYIIPPNANPRTLYLGLRTNGSNILPARSAWNMGYSGLSAFEPSPNFSLRTYITLNAGDLVEIAMLINLPVLMSSVSASLNMQLLR